MLLGILTMLSVISGALIAAGTVGFENLQWLWVLPLGALLPAANGKLRKFLRTFFASAALILTVEVLQLFTLLGSCDVDDLILNMAGVILGYLLWKLCRKRK